MKNTANTTTDLTASPVLIHALEWFTGSPLNPEAMEFARFATREVHAHGYRPFTILYAEFRAQQFEVA